MAAVHAASALVVLFAGAVLLTGCREPELRVKLSPATPESRMTSSEAGAIVGSARESLPGTWKASDGKSLVYRADGTCKAFLGEGHWAIPDQVPDRGMVLLREGPSPKGRYLEYMATVATNTLGIDLDDALIARKDFTRVR
jgi:hypothetical protein